MKTNYELKSESRKILGQIVPTMSKDGYVCITGVVELMNKRRHERGLKDRKISEIIDTNVFRERCTELLNKLDKKGVLTKKLSDKIDAPLQVKSIMDLSKLGLSYRRGKGAEQRWFVNPYLFTMIAMEMDPEIYADVVIWLHDGFIASRNEAGEAYIKMSTSIRSIVDVSPEEFREMIQSIAKAINYIVFNRHEDGMRNFASKMELDEIVDIEKGIVEVIDDGFVTSFKDLINLLRRKWLKKWGNPIDKILPR